MRIIAGKFRRRQLLGPPKSAPTRPIPDRVKESIFSILRGHMEGARVLDAFAGTGAIGLEAISRGASECVFVERDKRAAEVLERNIQSLGCAEQAAIVRGDALGTAVLTRLAAMGGADLMFFDPPYPLILDATPESFSGSAGSGGWARTKAQLERCIAHLSDHGYLILRTPWPFRHPDDPSLGISDDPDALDEASAPPRPHRGKGSGGRGNKHRHGKGGRGLGDIETSWIGPDIDIERIQRETRELEARLNARDDTESGPPQPNLGGRGAGKRGSPNPRASNPSVGAAGGGSAGFKRHLTLKDLDDDHLDDEFDMGDDEGGEEGGMFTEDADLDDGDEAGGFGESELIELNDEHPDELSDEHGDDPAALDSSTHAAARQAVPAPTFHMVDLTLAGAVGPETHVYGSTAMHLYMRKR